MKEPSPYFIRRTMPPPTDKAGPAAPAEPAAAELALSLWNYWLTIRKHLRLVGTISFAALLLTALVELMMKPTYSAESVLLIERSTPQVLDMRQVMSEPVVPDEYDYYKTQYGILKSKSIAAQVIREQALGQTELFPDTLESAQGLVFSLWKKFSSWLARSTAGAKLLSALSLDPPSGRALGVAPELIVAYLKRLDISPIRGTRLLKISFSATSPELSARVTNAHALAYIRQGLELNSRTNQEAQRFLEDKLVELKERLEKSEAALNVYRRDKGIISLTDKEDVVVQRLDQLNKDLTAAESERISYEAQEQQIRKRDYNSLPAVIGNELIQKLKEESAHLEGAYAHMASKFKRGFPPLEQLRAQLDQTRSRLNDEIQRVVGGIETSFLAAVAKQEQLRQRMDEQKALALAQKDAGVQYAILAREVDTNRQLYDSVLQRMKETGVAAQVRASNIFIIDKANPPNRPSRPRRLRDLLIVGVVSLAAGIVLVFLLESLDNTLRNPDEVEQFLRLPNLAVIPNFLKLNGIVYAWRQQARERSESYTPGAPSKELVACRDHFSVITESYRNLRTAILLSRAAEPPRSILITSATSEEGKTITAVNAAVLFAQMGVPVLLVDADLRRPRCHKVLRIDNRLGLTEVLTGQIPPQEAICSTSVERLFLLSAGAVPPNPAELVGSNKMQQTLAELRDKYDFIIIDSVPTMLVSDALPLSTMVDGAVVVVNGPRTPRHLVKAACERLQYVGATVLGVVLNRVDTRSPDYYYSHYYYSYHSSYYRDVTAADEPA